MNAIPISHRLYGAGFFTRLLAPPGHARATFDGTPDYPPGDRRVLLRDLTLRERVAEHDRCIADMMGHDGRAVVRCLRESV